MPHGQRPGSSVNTGAPIRLAGALWRGLRSTAHHLACWISHLLFLNKFKPFDRFLLAEADHEHCDALRKTLFVGLVLLFAIDPFQLQEATLAVSGEVSDRLDAMRYTAPLADKIAVVLVDEPSFATNQQNWPPSFPFWNDLLAMTLLHRPAAVYFDFSFDYPRPSFTTPQDAAWQPASDSQRADAQASLFAAQISGEFSDQTVPVILGSQGRLAALRGRLAGCSNTARNGEWTSVLPVLGCAATETTFYDFPLPEDHRGYPLWTSWPAKGGLAVSRTPAVALAALSCGALHPAPSWCGSDGTGWLALSTLKRGPAGQAVIPRWSLYASDHATPENAINEMGCTRYRDNGSISRDWNWFILFVEESLAGPMQNLLPDRFRPIEDRAGTPREPCLPFPVITASTLLDHSGVYDRPLDDLLRNRIVLIGDGRAYSPDHVPAPLHKNLPGVILQATTLETLLDFGRNFPKISDHLRSVQNRTEVILRVGILISAIMLDIAVRHLRQHLRSRPRQDRLQLRALLLLSGARDAEWPYRWARPLRVVFGWRSIIGVAAVNVLLVLLLGVAHWAFLGWVFLVSSWLLMAMVLLRIAATRMFTLAFAIAAIALVLWLRGYPTGPANWVFLITEVIVIALSLGDIKPPGSTGEGNEKRKPI